MRQGRTGAWLLVCLLLPATARADAESFELLQIPGEGRTVAAELVDLDGDARTDLLVFSFVGLPPREKRSIRIHLQRPDGSLDPEPDFVLPLPEGAAAYDLAELDDTPGAEILLLGAHALSVVSLPVGSMELVEMRLPNALTVGAGAVDR